MNFSDEYIELFEFFGYGDLMFSSHRHALGLKTLSIEPVYAKGFIREGQNIIPSKETDEVFGLIIGIPKEQRSILESAMQEYSIISIGVYDGRDLPREVETFWISPT